MKKKIIIILTLTTVVLTSCYKTPGCTDYKADNYSPSAEENDGSCVYSGDVVFWISSQFNYIDVTVNGETKTISSYYPSAGVDCGSSGCASFHLQEGSYSYHAEEQGLFGTVWNGTIIVPKKACKSLLMY